MKTQPRALTRNGPVEDFVRGLFSALAWVDKPIKVTALDDVAKGTHHISVRGDGCEFIEFDAQACPYVQPKTIYLLYIGLIPAYRRKGYGRQLYNLVDDIGRYFGCEVYEQTPSGTAYGTEDRALYLARHGFTIIDYREYGLIARRIILPKDVPAEQVRYHPDFLRSYEEPEKMVREQTPTSNQ